MITNKLKQEMKAQILTKRPIVPHEERNWYHETSSKKMASAFYSKTKKKVQESPI